MHDLLVISDLHLGDDLGPKSEGTLRLERELQTFLDHHRDDGHRWQLVINGDMIDLVGVTLMPADVGWIAGLHPDDHHYGLGARSHPAALKLQRVLLHHDGVFRALGRFLASGHSVAIVIGNHDVEVHWPEVQTLFVDALLTFAIDAGADPDAARDAISFHDWFFLEEGLAWIEHGHQYDPYCSFEEILEPATDAEEIDPNLGALLPRYVGSRMADDVHDAWGHGFFGYLKFWANQGSGRAAGIGSAYIDVFLRMFEHWNARAPERLAARRARAHARLRVVARTLKLPEERLLALAALALPPLSVDLGRIVRALMVDRLLLMLTAPALLLSMLLLPWTWMPWAFLTAALPLGVWSWYATLAREPVDPSDTMRAMAGRIREIARVPIVVMGHSHNAFAEGDGRGWYFNTGTWVPSHPERAFTHVRIERTAQGVRALLCQWRDGATRTYDAAGVAAAAAVPRDR